VFEGHGIATKTELWRAKFKSSEQLGDDIEIIFEPNSQLQEIPK
jgi:hypothetical protein